MPTLRPTLETTTTIAARLDMAARIAMRVPVGIVRLAAPF
jgi:hypothetical protein